MRAHPRSRGDHEFCRNEITTSAGPPPLARGPPSPCCHRDCTSRPTPARAGTTGPDGVVRVRLKAHPRSRGDHRRSPGERRTICGPPPLARGPRRHDRDGRADPGPTPARAGTTGTPANDRGGPVAHPRSRGDHTATIQRYRACVGPPPLARGPLGGEVDRHGLPRPTPARAGTTIPTASADAWMSAHPRSRGDHMGDPLEDSPEAGPPPLARGPPARSPGARTAPWPTPARAGTTPRSVHRP